MSDIGFFSVCILGLFICAVFAEEGGLAHIIESGAKLPEATIFESVLIQHRDTTPTKKPTYHQTGERLDR